MTRLAAVLLTLAATPVLAHPGHEAGRTHWIADMPHAAVVVLAVAALALAAACLKPLLRRAPQERRRAD
jgi:hypothetical protein